MTQVDLSIGAPGAPEVEVELDDDGRATPTPDDDTFTPSAVNPDSVRGLLRGLTGASRQVFTDVDARLAHPNYLKFTDDELDVLVPAIVRLAERRPALARAIERSDELTIAMTLAGYLGRNADEHRQITNERKARANQGQVATDAGAVGPDGRVDDGDRSGRVDGGHGLHPAAGGVVG